MPLNDMGYISLH